METSTKVTVAGVSATVDPNGSVVIVSGVKCSGCKVPLRARGTGKRRGSDNRSYEADAICVGCGEAVGLMRAEVSTIFGVEEDENIFFNSRCRVY